jgi:sugar O-acyltransferase (sialic acid O-acetyltransferase NeuD family)
MKTLAIYGSGGLGREVLDLAISINKVQNCYEDIIFIDDTMPQGEIVNGHITYPFTYFLKKYSVSEVYLIIALGEPKHRNTLRKKVQQHGFSLATLIHPTAFIGTDTKIGDGAIIQYGTIVSCNVIIGDNVLLQSSCTVGHDTVIGSDSVVSTAVSISGTCTIGERVYIGVSAPIKEHISIGNDSIIGMGAVVLRDIPENVVALGNPARPMRENTEGRVFK